MLSTPFRSSQRVRVGRPPATCGRHHDSAVGKRTPAWQRCQWIDGGRCRDYWCMGAGRRDHSYASAGSRDSGAIFGACAGADTRPAWGGSSVSGALMRQRAAVIG